MRSSFHFLAALLGVPAMLFALPETPPPTAPPAEPAPAEQAPAPEPACTVPAEAAGFRGKVTGVVETIHERQTSFKLKITRAEPAADSKAAEPQALVGLVIAVGAKGAVGADGKWAADPAHVKWIANLKAGQGLTIGVTYSDKKQRLRLAEVPPAPVAP